MKHTHLNWKFITVFFALSLYFSRTCNGLLHDLNDECSNCTMVLYKTRGTFADCSSRGFIRVPYCKVANIKQLFLSSNRIVTIHENAFQSMKTLEVIALDGNKIQYIHEKAFYNLLHLRELHIEYNELNQQSFSKNLFYPLINLRVLHICGNPFEYDKIHTLENAVSALNSLRSLHIPGFEGFDFEHTFRNLNRLTDLQMCDGYITYTNKTFSGFVNNTIEYISIRTLTINKDTFKNFEHVKGLDVSGYDTIVNVLESLSPFQNKSMEYLRIGDNSGGFNFRPIVTVTSKNFKYLANICTSEINLRYDRILHITQAALASLKHINCIKKIDLSGNLLTSAIIPGITLFRNLEYLNMCCLLRKRVKRTLQDITNKLRTKHNIRLKKPNKTFAKKTIFFRKSNFRKTVQIRNYSIFSTFRKNDSVPPEFRLPFENIHQNNTIPRHLLNKHTPNIEQKENITSKDRVTDYITNKMDSVSSKTSLIQNQMKTDMLNDSHNINEMIIFFSPHLQVINMSYTIGYDVPNITFYNGKGMTGIDAAFSNLECNFFIQGMPNLIWFNVSYWHCQYLIPSFLQYYPNLKVFIASHANLNQGLQKIPDGSLFRGLTKLEHVDLSYNDLLFLPLKIFQSPSYSIKILILSGNILIHVPENLLNLTNLTLLDLSFNNYTLFSKSDMQVISTLISRGTRIKLEGNKFICTCDTGDFIRWLFSLKNRIDFERNKCVMNNGTWRFLTDIKIVRYDLDLGCSYKFWLTFSISGISVLTGVLLLSVIVYRYRIEIEYFLYKLQWWLFPRQPSNDYDYDVIILFSHLDTPFAKNVLLTYLENELKLKTYFYPRDSLPGENIADSICENIQKSRKVIFVLTENYLKSRWIGFEFDQARMYMYKMYSEHNIIIITKGDISIKKCPDIIKNLYSRILFLQYPKEDSDEERNAFHRKLKEVFKSHKKKETPEVTILYDRNDIV